MKLTTKKTVEFEIDIPVPSFIRSKTHHFYYKVYSQDYCIQVYDEEIGIKHATIFMIFDYEFCTESEFLDKYNKVNSELCQLATV
jgi:hypothetical protein